LEVPQRIIRRIRAKRSYDYLYIFFFLAGVKNLLNKKPKIRVGISLWFLIPLIITFAPPAKALFFNRYISFMMPVYIMTVGIGLIACLDGFYKLQPQNKIPEGAFIFPHVDFYCGCKLHTF
jgi:hypothetical protein